MGQERRRFVDEFKTEAVALLTSSGWPLVQIAGELGISPSMLRNWRHRGERRNAGSAPHPRPAWRGRFPGFAVRTTGCPDSRAKTLLLTALKRASETARPRPPNAPVSTTASFTFIGNRVEEAGLDKRLGSSMDCCETQLRTFRHV